MPKISVVMPVYNSENYLKDAIDSILSQTYTDFEFIIIDDCSSDSSVKIIEEYNDNRIVFLKNEENMGVAKTLNKGLSVCCGKYVARMDSDDISLPERFEKQLRYLEENENTAVVSCGVQTFCEDKIISESGWSNSEPAKIKKDLFFSCAIAHPTVMMRLSAIKEVGGYDPDYNGVEDYELWCRVSDKYDIASLKDVLFKYRMHEGQVSRKPPARVIESLKNLKRRQIKNIDAELDQDELSSYIDFCIGKRDHDVRSFSVLHSAFCKISEANKKSHIYDSELLDCDLRSILINTSEKFSKKEQKEVFKKSSLVSPSYIRKFRLKKTVKKLLKR